MRVNTAVVGPAGVGKSTFLFKLFTGETGVSTPQRCLLQYRKTKFHAVEGRVETIHSRDWPKIQAVIFCENILFMRVLLSLTCKTVVSSAPYQDLQQATEQLATVCARLERGAPVLVGATFAFNPAAVLVSEITTKLGLNSVLDRPWFIQPMDCISGILTMHTRLVTDICVTGEGLYEGLDWLSVAAAKAMGH